LSGNKLTEADTRVIAKVDVRDEGFFLVHRITGVIEMMESTRTTKLPDGGEKIERYRMRQIDGAHDHEWREEDEDDEDDA